MSIICWMCASATIDNNYNSRVHARGRPIRVEVVGGIVGHGQPNVLAAVRVLCWCLLLGSHTALIREEDISSRWEWLIVCSQITLSEFLHM